MLIFQYNFKDFSIFGNAFLSWNRIKIEWKMPSELEGLIFPYFFAENRILGCLGAILEASWAVLAKILGSLGPPKTRPRCAKISQNRPQEPPQRRLEGVPEASGRSLVTKKQPRPAQNHPDLDVGASKPEFSRIFDIKLIYIWMFFWIILNKIYNLIW